MRKYLRPARAQATAHMVPANILTFGALIRDDLDKFLLRGMALPPLPPVSFGGLKPN